jgi:CRISPR-associated protein Cas1
LLTERLRKQIGVSRPKEKRLWQQVVRAKIAAQAANLEAPAILSGDAVKLRALIDAVASGDPTNVEGQAAKIYWPALLGGGFRRARGGAWPNPMLNYGYMVMRASVARAIAGAGLHPSFGIHHHNRGNAFCLADDLLEPLRPMVDAAVYGIIGSIPGDEEPSVTPAAKKVLLALLARDVELAGQSGPLMVQLHRMAASLWECYAGERETLDLPTYRVGDLFAGSQNADN